MDVSVIVINFNTFELTSACIKSVYEKTTGVNFEVILVDNGSSERPPAHFKALFPEIKLIVSETNVGFAKGNNLGLKLATGTTVLLLNSDTLLLNNAIGAAFTRLLQLPDTAAIAGKLFSPDGKVQHNVRRFPSIKLLLLELFRIFHFLSPDRRGKLLMGGYFSYQKELYADWVWATFMLLRQDVIAKFTGGQLHTDFFMYEEDKQWCYYMQQMGYKIIFSPEPHILHYGSGSSKKEIALTLEETIITNEYIFLSKIRSKYYAKLFFLLKAALYATSKFSQASAIASLYLRKALTGPLKLK